MKPLPCPGGRGPHHWKLIGGASRCDRCGLHARTLEELRAAQVEADFQRGREIRPHRPGVLITPVKIHQPAVKILGVTQ